MDLLALTWITLFSIAVSAILYIPHLRCGLNMADEGYLWFGTLETMKGAIPIRDFRAYDPGRYYLFAVWMRVWRPNLLTLRIGSLVLRMIGLTAGTHAVFLATGSWPVTIASCLLLAAWMYPPHKQIDILFAIAGTYLAVLLVIGPSPERWLAAGVFIGIASAFGLNHGLYAFLGFSLLFGISMLHGDGLASIRSLAYGSSGLLLGALPFLAFLLFVPGLLKSYWNQKVMRLVRRGTTNLPTPIPWLWRSTPAHILCMSRWGRQILRTGFTLMPILFLFVLGAAVIARPSSPREWAILAASSIGVGYMHHAMSRADFPHLTQGISPFLVALCATLSLLPFGWIVIAALALLSLRHIYLPQEGFSRRPGGKMVFERLEAGGTTLLLPEWDCNRLSQIRNLVDRHSSAGDPVWFAPNLVMLYPLLDRTPAAYDTFCVYPAAPGEEDALIEQLRRAPARLVLVHNHALDEREALRFCHTHPKVWRFLEQEFVLLETMGVLPSDHHFFVNAGERQDAVGTSSVPTAEGTSA